MTTWVLGLARELTERYQLHEVGLTDLGALVNDVVAVSAAEGEFALKVYHRNRTLSAVQWEVDLLIHLHRRGAPVVPPIRGRNGYLEDFTVEGQQRVGRALRLGARGQAQSRIRDVCRARRSGRTNPPGGGRFRRVPDPGDVRHRGTGGRSASADEAGRCWRRDSGGP